jgi:hypothetical protein
MAAELRFGNLARLAGPFGNGSLVTVEMSAKCRVIMPGSRHDIVIRRRATHVDDVRIVAAAKIPKNVRELILRNTAGNFLSQTKAILLA